VKVKTLVAGVALIALGTTAAGAADLGAQPYVKTPPPPVPVLNWTGFYIGANIGGAWSDNSWTDSRFLTNFGNNGNNGAFIGGGQVGGNYQIGQFVVGGEWDFDWAGSHNGPGVFIPGVGPVQISGHSRYITTVAARFGYAIDQWLVYGKAGGGWVGNNNLSVTDLTTGVSVSCGTFTNFTNCGNNSGGWLVGAGAEWAFAPHWSLKFEYDYLGLGNRSFTIPAAAPLLAGDTFTSSNRNVQMFKVGVNYLWNWGYNRY
jgi:outer membrane immunogenic protein